MSSRKRAPSVVPMRVLLIVSAFIAIIASTSAARRLADALSRAPQDSVMAPLHAPGQPIAAEAQVFRTSVGMLAIDPMRDLRRDAHPRTLATYRALRAYPGAPPRIPHGLTPGEFQTGGCKTCHERGGFSQRFGAYVPVTPHPEMGACLQCHVGDATLMAIPLPGLDPSARCRQCHAPGATRWLDSTVDWRPAAWPALRPSINESSPPPIPHPLGMRGNCLACHAPPAGVAGIRMTHPERTNCRQCHVEAPADTVSFVRPARQVADGPGSVP